jgi:hypothetical protein
MPARLMQHIHLGVATLIKAPRKRAHSGAHSEPA